MSDDVRSIICMPLGYALALVLLLSLGYLHWAPLVFPLWVLLISVHILLANLKPVPASAL